MMLSCCCGSLGDFTLFMQRSQAFVNSTFQTQGIDHNIAIFHRKRYVINLKSTSMMTSKEALDKPN